MAQGTVKGDFKITEKRCLTGLRERGLEGEENQELGGEKVGREGRRTSLLGSGMGCITSEVPLRRVLGIEAVWRG